MAYLTIESLDTAKRPLAPQVVARRPKEPKLYMTPMGWTTQRPAANDSLPPIDRTALMQNAHVIARRYREACPTATYAQALAYGLKAAWGQWRVARSIQSLNAQVARREHTAAEIEASRVATRRCGSSYLPF